MHFKNKLLVVGLIWIPILIFVLFEPIFAQNNLTSKPVSLSFSLEKKVSVIKDSTTPWKFRRNGIDLPSAIESSFFLNQKDWWFAVEKTVLFTNDAGLSWERWPLNLKDGEKVKKIVFVNKTVGWILVQPEAADSILDFNRNYYQLLKTNDGGKTWHFQGSNVGALASDVVFMDEKNGWLSGTRYLGISPVRYTYFIQKTNDAGQTWTDLRVNRPTDKIDLEKPLMSDNDSIEAMVLAKDGNITLASYQGRLFTASEKEENLGLVGRFEGRVENSKTFKISDEMSPPRFWMAEHSDHHNLLISSLITRENKTWNLNLLPNIYLLDIYNTEPKNYFAAGYEIEGRGTDIAGIVLKSNDDGKTWSVLFRSYHDRIQAIYPLSQKTLIVITSNNGIGTLVMSDAKGAVSSGS